MRWGSLLALWLVAAMPALALPTPGADTTGTGPLLVIDSIRIEGLVRTRERQVLREMTFGPGARIPRSQLDTLFEANRNLVYNTGLFTQVQFRHALTDSLVVLTITVTERWYLWPEVYFRLEDQTLQDWFRNPDFERITYGAGFVQRNLTGRNDNLSIRITQGFNRGVQFGYGLPFLVPKSLLGFGVGFRYTANSEVLYGNSGGELLRLRQTGATLREQLSASVSVSKRLTQYVATSFSVVYGQQRIADTLFQLNPEFLSSGTEFQRRVSASFRLDVDTRDVRPFPLKGNRTSLGITYNGLDSWPGPRTALFDVRHYAYRQVGKSPYYYAVGGSLNVLLGQEIAFADRLQLGNNGVRGFNSFSIDGTLSATLRGELRYALVARRIVHWQRLPRQFRDFPFGIYPFVFLDTGGVYDERPDLTAEDLRFKNRLLASTGAGFDLIYFYDNVFRLEYALTNRATAGLLFSFSLALR